MKFSQMKYTRLPIEELLTDLDLLTTRFNQAQTPSEAISLFWQYESVARTIETSKALAYIRHTINTKDDFYNEENNFFDENMPALSDKELVFLRAVLNSPYKSELEKTLGKLLFQKIEILEKSMCPEILTLMAQENALCSEYEKLYASARFNFDGKQLTLSEMVKYKQSTCRETRKAAYEADGKWFDSKQAQLDDIFDKLVKNRTEQALKMGFDSYVPLGYIRMQRIGYSEKEIEGFREQIKKHIVPAVAKIHEKQRENLELDKLMLWDTPLFFKDGNANPIGTSDDIMAAGRKMYQELSPQTAEFIDLMLQNELFDVLSREGKGQGGYCEYLEGYKVPFIFANFNQTADDVDVLTHEAGHAFASFLASKKALPRMLEHASNECCEIHSMAMEFLTSDFHYLFFGENTDKYQFAHTAQALEFLPYGTMVDEFQHIVYKNPQLTPMQRNEEWAKLEQEYRPDANFGDMPFYSRYAGWQRQLHIYVVPFYYIDYCLAQSVALQFYAAFLNDKKDAWQRYLSLTEKAGTLTYTELVKAASFNVPFEEGALEDAACAVLKQLSL